MKRNFDLPLIDIEGKPYTDGSTLKTAAVMALQAQLPGDERMAGKDKVEKIYGLATKIVFGGVIDLSAEQIAFLKDRIGAAMHPMVVGAAWTILDADFVESAAPAEAASAP